MTEHFHPDRLQRLVDLRAAGVDPYPPRAGFDALGPQEREPAAALVAAADSRDGETVAVCGRILGRRGYGKLVFLDLWDRTGRIQACLQKDKLSAEDFALLKLVNRGDFVAVRGELTKTQKGEPTVFGSSFEILSKALLDPPEKWHGLNDPELRARLRYVDLFTDPEARQRYARRSAILHAMRGVFQGHDYLEVETPVLHPIYGGAAARPFLTHHNAQDMQLYLRIAPELYLKRLIVGGMERVCEFARVFRNEGISNRHNPEFTMLEFYEAFTDYQGMADLTEELVVAAAHAAGCEGENGLSTEFRGKRYDLAPPYPRERYRDLFAKALGFDPADRDKVVAALTERGMELPAGEAGWAHWKGVNDLFEAEVEPALDGPVFVMDYPQAISPLAKPCPGDPEWTERFEFFLGGMELANAFSELNDPELQLENFRRQVDTKDPEAPNEIDWDYVRALAYGMPPAGGCGIGIDRLAMVLLGVDSIRDVLLFPLLRPEVAQADAEPPAEVQG